MHGNSAGRYAIYHAPEEGSALHEFGRRWLGRNELTGEAVAQYAIPGFDPARLRQITESPRHYGFHGTLKAPFHLANGARSEDLLVTARELAARSRPPAIGSLELKWMGKFLALVPASFNKEIEDFAAACVRHFDAFRAPPTEQELIVRRSAGLTERQLELLDRWGYPYVMDQFRFHLTLTGPMENAAEMDSILVAAESLTRPLRKSPLLISSFCLFQQPHLRAPFRLTHRWPFSAPETTV